MSEPMPDPQSFLPLSPAMLHILLSLGDGDRHGYGIMRAVQEHTQGRVRLGAGALYDSIKRLLAQGLIVECAGADASAGGDERRRYYRLTRLGRQVVGVEVERLAQLVEIARNKNLFPEGT
ncbi:PadR family transcriptional regulator [Gloeobacter violaceus]|uniref:Gll2428 protein n=1 Tax=Gloeobacter violaceus (strain ATCC 29082 / PCC 7421) TaxID=251221 RepID=Q7NHV7_GLOVI|nr:helix-turn-helix transcriptional regulator [Gloeobacter violaceus]BAC90369.1 gll2428 [Gloeobacter violaceus PCC 7421]